MASRLGRRLPPPAERSPGGMSGRPPAGRGGSAFCVSDGSVILDGSPMSAPHAISLRGVTKRFGEITAVDGLDLDVPEGTCVGLLGPNGAGKSTTMKMLTAQAIADAGEIQVL